MLREIDHSATRKSRHADFPAELSGPSTSDLIGAFEQDSYDFAIMPLAHCGDLLD